MIEIYTDGACKGNQHAFNQGAGWGVVIRHLPEGTESHLWGSGTVDDTNQTMEMTAAIQALRALEKIPEAQDQDVILFSDSTYVIKGITEWIHNWKQRGWKTSDKKPVKNKELWMAIEELSAERGIKWAHVKAHNGNQWNELADDLANLGAKGEAGSKRLQP